VKVNARYGQYFGQYDPGVEGAAARFQNYGETGISSQAVWETLACSLIRRLC